MNAVRCPPCIAAVDGVEHAALAGKCGPILVVDDDAETRVLLAQLARRLGCATRDATTGEAALKAVQRETPALVLIEVRLPDTSGYEICRELRDRFGESLPIVFLSHDRTERSDHVAGLLVGADDYFAKPFAADEMLARVRRLLARSGSPSDDGSFGLTSREGQVLALLTDGHGQAEIASTLSVSARTVGKHIENILRKLGVHTRTQAVAFALRNGLVENGANPTPAPVAEPQPPARV
jgi:two-component system nitrate/nitrite response regulator NarL